MNVDNIGGFSSSTVASQASQGTDTMSKDLQTQIANAKQQLQNLSKNEEMSVEEKEKKRREIQKQISELNNQLRQHQIELRKEKKQGNDTSIEDIFEDDKKSNEEKETNQNMIPQTNMEAMISADTAMSHAKAQGSVISKMEGKAGVLQSEIALDNSRGGSVEKKQGELSDIEQDITNAKASQFSTLGAAHKKIREAVKQDNDHTAISDNNRNSEGEKTVLGAVGNTTTVARKNSENNTNPFTDTVLGGIRAKSNFSTVDIHF